MKKIILISLMVLAIVLVSCTTTITTRMVNQPVPNSIDTKQFLDAVTFVLVNNGFDIKMMNESFGLVNTDWRPVKSKSDTAANVLSALSAGFSGGLMTNYSRVMMIQVQLNDTGYTLTPKLRRQARTSSIYGTSTDENVNYPDADSAEGQLAIRIVQEINGLLNLPNSYHWEEKVIEISL